MHLIGDDSKATRECPCGYKGHPERVCSCSPLQIQRYRGKISGPLMDRIDIQVWLSPVKFGEWSSSAASELSAAIRERVLKAREVQRRRFSGRDILNGHMEPGNIRTYCALPDGGSDMLETAMKSMGLSARSLDKILKIARTIADLDGSEKIEKKHIAEAVQYRGLDRSSVLV